MHSILSLFSLICLSFSAKFDPAYRAYNLNQNETATHPLDYGGEWANHQYHPSPSNWRIPFYTLFLDRFANGDPSNDNINGTVYEQDILSNQLRHGGDVAGLVDSLDYLHGMGIKAIYIAGSPFLNLPWTADSYSPVDLTILDHHFGTIDEWRNAVEEIHKRGMYIVLDNTFATMGDLIGFQGYLNETAPFTLKEHRVLWKSNRRYLDFDIGNTYKEKCEYPRFWNETGYPIDSMYNEQMVGCYDSDFDQYGDTEAFGVYPDFRRQLTKFASVQDRLRDWKPSVRERIQHFSCIAIQMLDIDGFRFDKATQITVDAQAEFGDHIRKCAAKVGKKNFFLPGEITGGNTFASIYLGRGRQPDMISPNVSFSVSMTPDSDPKYFIREKSKGALDGAAFHYTIYRSLTRFLGMDGNLEAGFDANGGSWTDAWNTMLLTNDLVNPNTGRFDPRHMLGVTNQDVFRWPAIKNGTERMLLGLFITTIHLPGIPKLTWGEEQSFYVLDSTASNYIYGRQPMTSALAWQLHGCYALGSTQYYQMPLEAARKGCDDASVSLDHRDPSHPVHNIVKHMYYLRQQYPVLNDGWFLEQLSNHTRQVQYPGSSNKTTETGIWSVTRDVFSVQNLDSANTVANQSLWLVYHNDNETKTYEFDCSKTDTAFVASFSSGTTVKNLFFPHDEVTLTGATNKNGASVGCTDKMTMKGYEFKVYVPKEKWVAPPPLITKFLPGHDARIQSTVSAGSQESVEIELHFSKEMNCDSVTSSVQVNSTTEDLRVAFIRENSVKCSMFTNDTDVPHYVAAIPTAWTWKATVDNVSNGIHSITVRNVTSKDGAVTNSVDRFLFRIGQLDNPVVFPHIANYTRALLHEGKNDSIFISQKAAGAEKWRYSLNWGSSWSDWKDYKGGNTTLSKQSWSGTKLQRWSDTHIIAQYWSRLAGSSSMLQHADLNRQNDPPRRFPHLFAHGPFNQYGYDAGLKNGFNLDGNDGNWKFHFMTEWPDSVQLNVWGINPDGKPDASTVYGDINGDFVLDRLPPSSLTKLAINITKVPPSPYLAYRVHVNDGTHTYRLVPAGSRAVQIALFLLLGIIPLVTGSIAVWVYMQGFYDVKFNEIGISEKVGIMSRALRRGNRNALHRLPSEAPSALASSSDLAIARAPESAEPAKRRTVLIATMEYDIEDWNIKIKIGGLGVMAQLMGKNLEHIDLIWVVPCVGGVDYPVDTAAAPMNVTILDNKYEVQVQYHQLRNITYVLLDAPVFRGQTKSEPYPPRMDDLDSAIYYSAWNQCIAQTLDRFPVDLYHINDYHGCVAPLYLLSQSQSIPCCLSLHNAEFQGLWPMRTSKERKEVCDIFSLEESVVQEYVQFGAVFNLLHAGASYLRVHQKGIGAVGVSNKYGKRSWARYPIFWGLSKVGKLPNPDPTDTEAWDKQPPKKEDIHVDQSFEEGRADLKRQAQEWAGLEQRADAELFVFVGRWSNQKGVDLIADIFPSILESNKKVQLICIGPVIDLYGRFAALKLGKMMEKYPGRVFSKPEFTALPPYIFSGAEFALIPSRDEPFGLVAVEFGRKGALGVGARVGGLGQMPGWWYTVESTTTSHLLKQFREAITTALGSDQETRAMMRARSAKQRFPVQQWKEGLEKLQDDCIKIHHQVIENRRKSRFHRSYSTMSVKTYDPEPEMPAIPAVPQWALDSPSYQASPRSSFDDQPPISLNALAPRDASGATQNGQPGSSSLSRTLSMGNRLGPGHRTTKFAEPEGDDDDMTDNEYILQENELRSIRQVEGQSSLTTGNLRPKSRRKKSSVHSFAPSTSPYQSPSIRPREGDCVQPRSFLPNPSGLYVQPESLRSSVLSLASVVGEKKDFSLQKVDPFFTDSSGEYYGEFEKKLGALTGKNSEGDLCIEEFLVKSEKAWFNKFRDARLGLTYSPSPSRPVTRSFSEGTDVVPVGNDNSALVSDEFLLGPNYKPPTGLKKYLQMKIKDWPAYSLLLALGQIISANSYQITLLTGTVGQSAEKLYAIASVYLISSVLWWILFRRLKSVFVLSTPFFFYGLSFIILGFAPLLKDGKGKFWMQNVATGLYALASSSGSLYFALNFGDEGGAPVKDWIFRACVIQGTQQVYVAALWYWGSTLAAEPASLSKTNWTLTPKLAALTTPIAVLLWVIGIIVHVGLPDFYRQTPGAVPSFYAALARRKIVLWTLFAVILQNYFLSAPYGRNWQFLWSSRAAEGWQIALLFMFFFGGIWALALFIFSKLSLQHSWILPVFAIGLGAPRWCQMLWGTSSIGLYVPWAGGPVASALLSRSLWLWLGLLDTIQGVGFGMIFLQTLTRLHVAFTLIAAQVLGSVATIVARATAPNNIGPGDVFPDFSAGVVVNLIKPWFWIALAAQIIICVGFLKFFRKEQLSKP